MTRLQDVSLCTALPPRLRRVDGMPRRVGFEIEFLGLSLADAGEAIIEVFGGVQQQAHKYEGTVTTAEHGVFRLELDASLLKSITAEILRKRASDENPWWEEAKDTILAPLVTRIAPYEIISPPLPMNAASIRQMDALIEALRRRGAKGTGAAMHYAFGMHINAEAVSLEAADLLNYVRAFILLYDWLLLHMRMDRTRRLTAFAQPYPEEYARMVLDSNYAPDMATLIDDYIAHNPSRDRALDLLPIFLLCDPGRVRAQLDSPLIRPRPALHFRMPNSRVDEPDWLISHEWIHWVEVERLAANPRMLRRMAARYLGTGQSPLHLISARWRLETERWRQWI
jgi:hypothetical protein